MLQFQGCSEVILFLPRFCCCLESLFQEVMTKTKDQHFVEMTRLRLCYFHFIVTLLLLTLLLLPKSYRPERICSSLLKASKPHSEKGSGLSFQDPGDVQPGNDFRVPLHLIKAPKVGLQSSPLVDDCLNAGEEPEPSSGAVSLRVRVGEVHKLFV